MTVRTRATRRPTTFAAPTPQELDWRTLAACGNTDPELFFATGEHPEAWSQRDEALRTCYGCPVVKECLRWALEEKQDVGVLGGLTAAERLRLRGEKVTVRPERVVDEDRQFPNPEAVEAYLSGAERNVHPVDRLAAIVKGVRKGMTYPDFDRLHGLAAQSTSQFMSRARASYRKHGRKFPDLGRLSGVRSLTDEEVRTIRDRYAAGGVTDTELAMSFNVSRKAISSLLVGRTYKNVGGPIRPVRGTEKPRVWSGDNVGVDLSQNNMGEAA